MVKHFCDICGKEIEKRSRRSQVTYQIITDSGSGVTLKNPYKALDICNDCMTKEKIMRILKEKENDT